MLPRLMGAFLVGAMLPVLAGWALLGLLPGALWLLWRGHWPLLPLLLAGMAWTTSAVHQVNQMRLTAPASFNQEQVTIERCWQSDWSRRCLLSNSDGQRYYLTWQAETAPEPGLTGIASGRLQPWSATVSPGQTSFALWLLRHRIAARGQLEQFHPDHPAGLSAWQLNTRRWLRERTVPSEARGFYEALVLGDRSALDSTVRGQVARTQTQHLLALSGLHIGSLALWAYLIAGLLWRLYPVGVRQDWQKMAALLMAGLLLWIALPAVSLWRAFLMTLIPGIAWLMRRQFAAHHLLLLMGCLMVLGDPLIWLDLGAWFSWWATLVLIMLVRQIGHWPGWRQLMGIQMALSVLLVPVHALWALPLFPAGMVLNLVLIPWVSFVTLPLALLTAVGLPWANVLFGWAIDVWRGLLAVFDHLIAFLPVLSPVQAVILGLLAALALLTRWSFAGWALLVISGFALLLGQARPPALADHEFEVWVLDSGAGQTVVVETAGGRVLIDSGSGTGQRVNLSQPVLRWHWARPLQDWHTVVLSRPGRQTEGGLNALAAVSQPPSQAFASRRPRGEHWPENWPEARFCDLNARFELGDVGFRFVRPLPAFQPDNTRAGGCVLEVRSRAGSALIVNGGDVVTAHALAQSGQLSATDLVAVGGDSAAALPLQEATLARHLVFQQPMHADLPSAMTEGDRTGSSASLESTTVCTCGRQSWRYRFTDRGIIPLSYGLRLLPWLRI